MVGHALAVNVRIARSLSQVAVGAQVRSGPDADPIFGGRRFIFAVPEDQGTLLGTWYAVADANPIAGSALGVRTLVREFNQACPGLDLSPREVTGYQWGWLPLKGTGERGRPTSLSERPRMVDHSSSDDIRHLLSVEGVKFTTARSVAQRVVDRVFDDLGRKSPRCRTAEVPLDLRSDGGPVSGDRALSHAAVRDAVHRDMALTLSDIVFRRINLGDASRLSRTWVEGVARLAGAELGWDTMRQEAEIEDVMRQASGITPAEEPVG
jgi:glycerol-3-phosphate dehydrogenase